MKAAIYVRVSTDTQELNNQKAALIEYCLKSDWEVYSVYEDIASGTKQSRPAFDRLLIDSRKKVFDIVLFWALDRFSRSGTLYTLQRLNELKLLGIKFHSYTEPYLSSVGEFGDVVISIMATLAKIERERISERTKAGLRNAVNVGKRGKDKKPRRRAGYFKK